MTVIVDADFMIKRSRVTLNVSSIESLNRAVLALTNCEEHTHFFVVSVKDKQIHTTELGSDCVSEHFRNRKAAPNATQNDQT